MKNYYCRFWGSLHIEYSYKKLMTLRQHVLVHYVHYAHELFNGLD
jgi:hypothetical protein